MSASRCQDVALYVHLLKHGMKAHHQKRQEEKELYETNKRDVRHPWLDLDLYRRCCAAGLKELAREFCPSALDVGKQVEHAVKAYSGHVGSSYAEVEYLPTPLDTPRALAARFVQKNVSELGSDIMDVDGAEKDGYDDEEAMWWGTKLKTEGGGHMPAHLLSGVKKEGVQGATEQMPEQWRGLSLTRSPMRVLAAVRAMVSMEVACEPEVMGTLRELYLKQATLWTYPTARGKEEIDPFHKYHGIQHLRGKPIKHLLQKPATLQGDR